MGGGGGEEMSLDLCTSYVVSLSLSAARLLSIRREDVFGWLVTRSQPPFSPEGGRLRKIHLPGPVEVEVLTSEQHWRELREGKRTRGTHTTSFKDRPIEREERGRRRRSQEGKPRARRGESCEEEEEGW